MQYLIICFVIKMWDAVHNITVQGSVVHMPAHNNNIPYGNNHWLIFIYINKQFTNSK